MGLQFFLLLAQWRPAVEAYSGGPNSCVHNYTEIMRIKQMENADVCCSWVRLQAHLVYSSCGMPARQIKPIPSFLIHWCVLCACLQRKMGIFSAEAASHNKSAHKQNDLQTTRDITFRVLA